MKRRSDWTRWLEDFPAKGRITFTLEEAVQKAAGVQSTAIQALRRAAKDGWVKLIHRGLYAWVAPEYRKSKAPPLYWVIQAWMGFLGVRYYVGLLSAAALHGSAQQAPMEYHVITGRQIRNSEYAGGRVRFIVRANTWPAPELLERKQGFQDSFLVSGPELTLVDLVRNPAHSGGWDNIATIARDLGVKLRLRKLALALEVEETPVLQRLGWLLDHLGFDKAAKAILSELESRSMKRITLDPRVKREGAFDNRFQISINQIPQAEA